jgi:linoleoyl-CoA desaturase
MPAVQYQPIRFVAKDRTQFFSVLRKRVDQYFEENKISKHANQAMIIKMVILILGYVLPFALMLSLGLQGFWGYVCYTIMGFFVAGVGMSVMHDANHGAFSKKQKINDLVGYSLNLLGASIFNWKLQHNLLHHTYTNIVSHDQDVKARVGLKFNPHSKTKKVHSLQFLYAFFFYGLITLYWVVAKDLVQFITFSRQGLNKNTRKENIILFLKMTNMKILYFSAFFALPIYGFGFSFGFVLTGFLLMHFFAGLILTLIFQLAHTVEATSHPMPNEEGTIENDWAIHQMNTTVNFSRNNPLISWYVGGLNYQVEHHLFPKICHIHYPEIAPIVKKTAEEFGIPYLENESFGQALMSHIRFLREMGKMPSLNEAIG